MRDWGNAGQFPAEGLKCPCAAPLHGTGDGVSVDYCLHVAISPFSKLKSHAEAQRRRESTVCPTFSPVHAGVIFAFQPLVREAILCAFAALREVLKVTRNCAYLLPQGAILPFQIEISRRGAKTQRECGFSYVLASFCCCRASLRDVLKSPRVEGHLRNLP